MRIALTNSQIPVLYGVLDGLTDSEIANKLNVHYCTAKQHVLDICLKWAVYGRKGIAALIISELRDYIKKLELASRGTVPYPDKNKYYSLNYVLNDSIDGFKVPRLKEKGNIVKKLSKQNPNISVLYLMNNREFEISENALNILIYLIQTPDNGYTNFRKIKETTRLSGKKVDIALKELKYLHLLKIEKYYDDGRYAYIYTVYDTPFEETTSIKGV